MSDEDLRAHLKAAPDTPVIRLTETGRVRCVHECSGRGRLQHVDVTQPVVWTPDGLPPALLCYVGRCACGVIFLSESTLSR